MTDDPKCNQVTITEPESIMIHSDDSTLLLNKMQKCITFEIEDKECLRISKYGVQYNEADFPEIQDSARKFLQCVEILSKELEWIHGSLNKTDKTNND